MPRRSLVILGGGGHAKVLIDAILSGGKYKIKGILDPLIEAGNKVCGVEVLGTEDLLTRLTGCVLVIGVGTVKASDKRKRIFEKYRHKDFIFPAIVHPSAHISRRAKVKDGAQVLAGAVVNAEAVIGECSIINTRAIIEHDCVIGPYCHVGPGAILGGAVETGRCAHIGMGAKILQGIKIGSGATVGAGAVVISDVASRRTVAGVPARLI